MNKTEIGQKMDASLCSGNGDQYTGLGDMWNLAKRHNDQSILMHGSVTCRRVRKVEKTSQLPMV